MRCTKHKLEMFSEHMCFFGGGGGGCEGGGGGVGGVGVPELCKQYATLNKEDLSP